MFNRISTVILLLFAILLLYSCRSKTPDKDTWLVGKINNPRWDYVVIQHQRFIMDTIKLDQNNFFKYKFSEPVKEGVYTLVHDDSYPFYIASGDSLLLLSNTIDFEGSMYFTNDHAEENNLLVKLNNRFKNKNFYWSELFDYNPKEFEIKVKERKEENQKLLANFKNKNPNTSKTFLRIAKGVIDQDGYLNKERYTHAHRLNEDNLDPIPEDFFAYRKYIDFEKDTMEVYYPYYQLLLTYLDNYVVDSFTDKKSFNRSDFEINKYKLNLIDKLVNNCNIKNHLLYASTRSFLLHSQNSSEGYTFLELHNQLSSCQLSHEDLSDLNSYTLHIKPGNKVPNIQLLNYGNSIINLQEVIEKPSVLFFWSNKDIQHQKTIHTRVKELQSKYPEYQFIGINSDNHFKNWRREIDKLGYDTKNEFQFYKPDIGEKELVLTSKNKVLILDKNGMIRNGHANIYQRTIESKLLQYLN